MSERTRILIVDDDPGVRKTLSDILAHEGFAPLAVSSGKAALEAAPDQMPIIALIDLRLKDMSGLELMRELKKSSPNIECIVVTGHASQTSAIDAVNLGAYSYVQKPYDLPQLLLTIRRAIERRTTGEALRLSEARYRDLVEHSRDLICTHDLEGRILSVNLTATRAMGYSVDELIDRNLLDFLQPGSAGGFKVYLATIKEKGEASGLFKVRTRSGEARVWEYSNNLRQVEGETPLVRGMARDVTQRWLAEKALRASEERYRLITDNMQDTIWLMDMNLKTIFITPSVTHLRGYTLEELQAMTLDQQFTPESLQTVLQMMAGEMTPEKLAQVDAEIKVTLEMEFYKKDGSTFWSENALSLIRDANGAPSAILGSGRDITERKRAEEELRQRNEELARLYRVSGSLLTGATPDLQSAAQRIIDIVLADFGQSNCSLFLVEEGSSEIRRIAVSGPYANQVSKKSITLDGLGLTSKAIRTGQTTNIPDVRSDPAYLANWEAARSELTLPLKIGARVIGAIDVQSAELNAFDADDERLMAIFAERAALALEQARMHEAEIRRAARLVALQHLSAKLATLHSQREVLETLVQRAAVLADSPACTIMWVDAQIEFATLAAQFGLPKSISPGYRVPLSLPFIQQAFKEGKPVIVRDIDRDAPALRSLLVHPGVRAFYAYPIVQAGRVTGVITLSSAAPRAPSKDENSTYELLAKLAAAALENARLFDETNRRLERLSALHTIDVAIGSSLNINLTLGVLLEQVLAQLNVHAADILVYRPETQRLRFACGRGFNTQALKYTDLKLGDGYAGLAALERRAILIPNLLEQPGGLDKSPNLAKEGFLSLVSAPLIAKGVVKGVLEIFNREALEPDQEWFDFLETLSGQAAIAIDSYELFERLQRSNIELSIAYDATIEGWSRALDLRDKETEGHTQRVTEITVQLAREMEVGEQEWEHVRRGALLHDIGKMGVPDHILLKPGKLTDEEWVSMRKHPQFAYDMLLPITYLRPALDIPYCHHEKWDGSGYPRGLKGEQIPLTARIFAVVDVWDALISDRPYRPAWSQEKALEHIRSQSGVHFDPRVVEAFLRMEK